VSHLIACIVRYEVILTLFSAACCVIFPLYRSVCQK